MYCKTLKMLITTDKLTIIIIFTPHEEDIKQRKKLNKDDDIIGLKEIEQILTGMKTALTLE